jgi:hypothetical protein
MKNSKEKNHDWKSGLYLWIKSSVVAHFKYLVAAIFIFAFVFAFLFQCLYLFHTDVNSARYMLSALVQSQAAIVAIVITLTLIAVQLTASAYSPRVVDVFRKNPGMWILLLLYGTSIFYGLIVLRLIEGNKGELVNQSVIWSFGHSITLDCCITLAFWLGIVAFVALIPYILYITDLLKPEKIIKELANGITKNKEYNSSKDPIQPIVDIIRGSIRKYDFETTKEGLKEVTNQVIKVVDLDCGEGISNSFCTRLQGVGKLAASVTDEQSTKAVIENLEKFGKDTAGKGFGDAAQEVVKSLEAVGIAAARKRAELEDAVKDAALSLEGVGKAAVENNLGDVTMESAKSLGAVGVAAAEKGKELKGATKQVAKSLGALGAVAANNGKKLEDRIKKELEKAIKQAVVSLEDVGKAAANNKLDEATEQVASSLKDVGKATAKFGDVVTQTITSLGVVGTTATENGKELEKAIKQAVVSLEDVGKTVVKNGHGDAARLAVLQLMNIGKTALENGLGDLASLAALYLEYIGEHIVKAVAENRLRYTEWRTVVSSLRVVGTTAAKKGLKVKDAAMQAVLSLKEVGTTATDKGLKDAKKDVVQALGTIRETAKKNRLNDVVREAALAIVDFKN